MKDTGAYVVIKYIKAFRIFFIVAVTASVMLSTFGGPALLVPVTGIALSALVGALGLAAAKLTHVI
ncbi:hypothetical protein [Ruegeria jejuensis]|uniref:hypothetical protein n=1 Tax=Ruegeria jejuensis TaxID=3233338 RepID=UPI00355C16B0